MTDKRNHLEGLFAAARTEPPVVTFGETRARVDEGVSVGSIKSTLSINSTHTIMLTTGIGILATTVIGFLSWNSGHLNPPTSLKGEKSAGVTAFAEKNDVKPLSVIGNNAGVAGLALTDMSTANGRERKGEKGDDGSAKKDSNGMYVTPAPFITGIRMLELSREELARLGLQSDTDGVWCFHKDDGGYKVTMGGAMITENPENEREKGVALPAFHPRFVTDDFGNRRMSVRDDADPATKEWQARVDTLMQEMKSGNLSSDEINELNRQIMEAGEKMDLQDLSSGKLVPILVRTGHSYTDADKAQKRWRPDCIFWYEPSPDFLAALPERVRLPLERELRLASVLQTKPEGESVEAFLDRQSPEIRQGFDSLRINERGSSVAGVAGEVVTGAFGTAAGALTTTSVLPNPASDRAIVRYTLASPRNVSLALYDVNGKLVRTLMEASAAKSGENIQSVDLKDVAAGMYLLVVNTDKGERGVQRLIVE